MKVLNTLTICAALAAALPASAAQPVTGRWITASGNLVVEIAPCGATLCGHVVEVLANRAMKAGGAAMRPADASDPLGMRIVSDLRLDGDGRWQGSIYNRENATTYDCALEVQDDGQLKVRAYRLLPVFGKTQLWQRARSAP